MLAEQEKISAKRWIVTYTKHMKQKRKVYQDGVLELCSSSGKTQPQILLYDDCDKVIDRRFLKKDEIVKSGGTLSFETHIVDVGDPDDYKKPSAESTVKSVLQQELPKEKLSVEWNVLYTMHMTQKAKKYHDGILRVQICSSHLNLITLLNEDGVILSSKYLKSVAGLQTGKNCEFPNYLVEIGERRDSAPGQEGYNNVRSLCKDSHKKDPTNQVLPSIPGKCGNLVTSRKECNTSRVGYVVPKKETCGWRSSNARFSVAPSNLSKDHHKKVTSDCNFNFNNSSTANLRDACQILSVLKRPSLEGSLVLSDQSLEHSFASKSSVKCQLNLQIDTSTKCIINNTGGEADLTTKVSEILGDPVLPKSNQTNELISDIGIYPEAIHNMKPIVPLQNSIGSLNGKHQLSASFSSVLKDNIDATERNGLHVMSPSRSSDSTPDQVCAKALQAGERSESVSFPIAASTVHSTSDCTKDIVISSSVEFANVEDFPTFDLGL